MSESYKIVHGYAVYETTDEMGRRGQLIGVYTDEYEAKKQAKGVGWYGGQGDVAPVSLLITEDGKNFMLQVKAPIDLNTNFPELAKKKRKSALSKLTKEEKVLLGLEEES